MQTHSSTGGTDHPPEFSAASLVKLRDSGLTEEYAREVGIVAVTDQRQLPEGLNHRSAPGMLVPWRDPTDPEHVVWQYRPDEPPVPVDGTRPAKYVFAKGQHLPLGLVRAARTDVYRTVIVEGTLQGHAVARHAPDDVMVLSIPGCTSWGGELTATPLLEVVEGHPVVIFPDADASTNAAVFDSMTGLGRACDTYGAESVLFGQVPTTGTNGMDDFLGAAKPEKRTALIERLMSQAAKKPAARRPEPRPTHSEPTPDPTGRPVVMVDEDRHRVIAEIRRAMVAAWDRNRLFNYGDAIARRDGASMSTLTRGGFRGALAETCRTMKHGAKGKVRDDWPDGNVMDAVLDDAAVFSPLDKISQAPFIRADGTVCQTPGYDAVSRTWLELAPGLDGFTVPDNPTEADRAAALALLTGDLLEGFPFLDQASRANALGLVLTPFIRGQVDLAPQAVIDAKEAGTGKGKLANCVSIIQTGHAAEPLAYSADDAENRKVMTSAFISGAELVVFDEAHRLEGANLARTLTATNYRDRILGGNKFATYPNKVTFVSLGNQVKVMGDISRRVYRIALHYPGANPMDRPTGDFRHPELEVWATEHRGELIRACLTLVRAWFAADQPRGEVPFVMGSFTRWQQMIAGVLTHAGVTGFMDNVREWRSENDFTREHRVAHLMWLHDTFGTADFTTAEVRERLTRVGGTGEPPPGLEDTSARGYARELGKAYAELRDREMDGFVLHRRGKGHNNINKWGTEKINNGAAPTGVMGVTGESPNPTYGKNGVCSDDQLDIPRVFSVRGAGDTPVTPVTPTAAKPSAEAPSTGWQGASDVDLGDVIKNLNIVPPPRPHKTRCPADGCSNLVTPRAIERTGGLCGPCHAQLERTTR
jgi:hypothetical protein